MGAVAYLRPVEPQQKDGEPHDPGGTSIVCPDCESEPFVIREFGDEWHFFCARCVCEIEKADDDAGV